MKKSEKFSTPELVKLALSAENDDEYWDYIAALHKRGTICEFEAALSLRSSSDPKKREIVADILGQLGWSAQSFQEESVRILIDLLSDPVDDVVASAAFSLGHRKDASAIPDLVKLVDHPNDQIRFGATFGLSCQEDRRAVESLILLSKDQNEEIRNWATFGLGSLIDINSEEVCNALLARKDEKNQEIRGEALLGLVRRKHPSAEHWLMEELNGNQINVLIVEAAEKTRNPKFYIALLKWRGIGADYEDQYFENCLKDALKACYPCKRERYTAHQRFIKKKNLQFFYLKFSRKRTLKKPRKGSGVRKAK